MNYTQKMFRIKVRCFHCRWLKISTSHIATDMLSYTNVYIHRISLLQFHIIFSFSGDNRYRRFFTSCHCYYASVAGNCVCWSGCEPVFVLEVGRHALQQHVVIQQFHRLRYRRKILLVNDNHDNLFERPAIQPISIITNPAAVKPYGKEK